MNCPLCLDSVLDVTFHAGIELDICPTCRGVWLDRGELDRIAAGSRGDTPASASDLDRSRRPGARGDGRHDDDDDWARDQRPRDARPGKKRKKSFADRLGDVFEEIVDL